MATSPLNITNLTQDALAKWLVEDFYFKIQIARVFPMMAIEGGMISYARTPALQAMAEINSMATILGDGTQGIAVQTASPQAMNVTFSLGTLATRYQLDYSGQDRYKSPNNIDATLAALAIRRLTYMQCRKLDLDTTGNPGDYPSLYDMCAASNLVTSSNGTALQRLEELQQAYSLVTANNGRPNAIMCNSRALRWIIAAYHGASILPGFVECEWGDPLKGTVRAPQLAINGTPIYINEMVASNVEQLTRIYFMVLGDSGEAGPTRGITGIVPAPLKDTLFVRRESSEPASVTSTSLINVDYTFPVATAMGSSGALAILEGVDVTEFPVPAGS